MSFRTIASVLFLVVFTLTSLGQDADAAQQKRKKYSGQRKSQIQQTQRRQPQRTLRSRQTQPARQMQPARQTQPMAASSGQSGQDKNGFAGQMAQETAFQADMVRAGKRGAILVAPAGGVPSSEVQAAHSLAESLHLEFPARALAPGKVPYTANVDSVRQELLAKALADPRARIVWSIRGGYGSGRLLPALGRMQKPTREKIFVGYSDMTFVHLLLQSWGWQTVHAAMVWEMNVPEKDPDNFRYLASLLAGKVKELRYDGLAPFNTLARGLDEPIRGVVTGGNLACLASAAGTPWALNASGKILFLEDIQEPGYRLDRLFTQLRDSGALKGIKAVVLGSFVQCKEDANFALERFASECGVPVFKTDVFGHGKKNYPLVFNAPAKLERAGNQGFRLTINTEALTR